MSWTIGWLFVTWFFVILRATVSLYAWRRELQRREDGMHFLVKETRDGALKIGYAEGYKHGYSRGAGRTPDGDGAYRA